MHWLEIANPTITTLFCIISNVLRSQQAVLFGSWKGGRGNCLRTCSHIYLPCLNAVFIMTTPLITVPGIIGIFLVVSIFILFISFCFKTWFRGPLWPLLKPGSYQRRKCRQKDVCPSVNPQHDGSKSVSLASIPKAMFVYQMSPLPSFFWIPLRYKWRKQNGIRRGDVRKRNVLTSCFTLRTEGFFRIRFRFCSWG